MGSEPAVAMTCAPLRLASWMAATDTPLAAAWIMTHSPMRRPAVATRACHAVE